MIAQDSLILPTNATALQVILLGRFQVIQGQRVIESEQWRSGKARNLFKILLNRRNYQISRQEALELLWPELDQERASNNLNQAVYSLRRTLEPDLLRAGKSAYLKTEGTKLQLQSSLIATVDLEEFRQASQQAQTGEDLSLYERATRLYTGDYLPEDLYEDWSISRREALRQQWINLLFKMAALCQNLGQAEKYQQCMYRILESDFSNEEAAQRLMRSLSQTGRREEALLFFRNFAARLHQRLNIEPLAETSELYDEIAGGRVTGRPATRPEPGVTQPQPAPVVASSVAPALSSLVGRQAEQDSWRQSLRLAQEGRGGLTLLLGEAGIGKTALAETLGQQARREGFSLLWLSGQSEQTQVPFQPIYELVEQLLGELDSTERQDCLKTTNASFARRVWPGFSQGETSPTEPTSEEIFAATAQVLSWLLNRRKRVALIIENLHYLSGPVLRLLRFWLSCSGLRGLVVLATSRSSRPASDPDGGELKRLIGWLETTQPQRILTLERFNTSELYQLTTARLGQPASRALIGRLVNLCQGNPRLALELLAAWQQTGWLQVGEGGWELNATGERLPLRVISYIGQVLADRSDEGQELLKLAALAGPVFNFEILRQVVSQRQDGAGWWIELGSQRLGHALTELTEAGLLEEQPNEFRFAYPLLPETLRALLSPSQRQCWQTVIEWAKNQTITRV